MIYDWTSTKTDKSTVGFLGIYNGDRREYNLAAAVGRTTPLLRPHLPSGVTGSLIDLMNA